MALTQINKQEKKRKPGKLATFAKIMELGIDAGNLGVGIAKLKPLDSVASATTGVT